MDASALLKKQGWRGAGHSLDKHDRGIAKPLLVANKQNLLGVGKKKTQVADQWWMRAYDNGLKELGSGNATTLSQIRQNGVNRGGLYGFFVKGQGLAGTITEPSSGNTSATETKSVNSSAVSESSTPATTPEADPMDVDQPSKKRKRESKDSKLEGAKREKEGKAEKRAKDEKLGESKPVASEEDAKALRRAAKKALRQKLIQEKLQGKAAEIRKGEASEATSDENTDKDRSKTLKKDRKKTKEGKKEQKEQTSDDSSALSADKLKKYAAKAAEKGMTVEAYLAKKQKSKSETSR